MNAPFVPDLSPQFADWNALASAIHLWCGKCLQHFARAEAEVSETLIHISSDETAGPVAFSQLVGCRFNEIERLLTRKDPPPVAKLLSALRDFRKHDRLRVFLCHGTASVLVDAQGEWYTILRLLAFQNGTASRDIRFLSRAETEEVAATLQRDTQRLISLLIAFRKG